jgi:hypothetical protein
MDNRQHIYILGNSLILGESLRQSGQYDLTCLKQSPDAADLESMHPDAIVFDLDSQNAESLFALPASCPKLLLVGVSPDTNLVKVWVGRQLRELSLQGLLTVIAEQIQN